MIPSGTKFIAINTDSKFNRVWTVEEIVLSQRTYISVSSNYTATSNDYMIECTSGTFNVQLPTAIGVTGKEFVIKNTGSGTITVIPFMSELIDDETSFGLLKNDTLPIMSNGSKWIISK